MSADHIVGKAVLFGDLSLLDEPEEFPGVVVSCSREVLRAAKRLPMQEEVALVPVSELEELKEAKRKLAPTHIYGTPDEILAGKGEPVSLPGAMAELKAERDANVLLESEVRELERRTELEKEVALLKDENVRYARFLNESGFTEFRLIERAQELEWELNYAALCVAENETLREALRTQGKEAQVSLVDRVREAEESARALRRSHAEKIGENAALRSEIERWRTATAKLRDAAEESGRVANEQAARAEAEAAKLQAQLDASCNSEELRQIRAELARVKDEVSEARKAWLGDDYGHLTLGDALAKLRADHDAEFAALRADKERLDYLIAMFDAYGQIDGLDFGCGMTRDEIDVAMAREAMKGGANE